LNEKAPLRARLHWYKLTAAEFSLLTAMCEHCSDGSVVWAAIPRLATYAKLSKRQVYRIIEAFLRRGIVTQLAPGDIAKRRPSTYRVNEAALEEDPRMRPYRSRQQDLPGIRRPAATGEPIPDPDRVTPLRQSGAAMSPDRVTPLHQSGAAMSPDSRSYDSTPLDPKDKTQHGVAALNSMPAWIAFKEEELRAEQAKERFGLDIAPKPWNRS
jgi:hypothetical protein